MQSLGRKGEDRTVQLSCLCQQKVSLEERIQRARSDEERKRLNHELARVSAQITRLTESLRALVE